jgi:uncharacterized protein YuzE
MLINYDPEADAFYARFAPEVVQIATTTQVAPGVMLDLDASGQLVGIKVTNVRTRSAGNYSGAAPGTA